MDWVVRISDDAQVFIDRLPHKARRQVSNSITQLEKDPFHGNVKAMQGKQWQGYYRKRTGDYRIIFLPEREQRIVDVAWVALKSEKTYHR
jgi:mRNA-degrading endonuclease RelE of RelBE toxin-antitoxin system